MHNRLVAWNDWNQISICVYLMGSKATSQRKIISKKMRSTKEGMNWGGFRKEGKTACDHLVPVAEGDG